MKVLTNHLLKQLEAAQLNRQKGFRGGFSTIGHIHTIKEIVARS